MNNRAESSYPPPIPLRSVHDGSIVTRRCKVTKTSHTPLNFWPPQTEKNGNDDHPNTTGERLLGIQIVGDSATELVHIGQLALQQSASIESFIDNVFNFPTYAEAYRVAALDIAGQAAKHRTAQAA
ncbi:MAG TPA: hypothetical protein VFX56_04370 [Nitrospira sp.]|nr:hypothetical protein [Nitrospira sp.]